MINDMRSIDKPANDMRSIDKPANDMRSIDKPSDRPSKCGVFDEEPFSEFERHQLDIPIAWSPCHLPRQQEISKLTPIERLWAVQQTLEAFQFDSIADALLLELKVGGRESVGVGKRTSRFFTNGKCVELLTAIVQHRKFALDDLLQQDNFVGVVSRLFKRISDAEMEKVTKSQVLQQGLVNFRPELFENNDIFNDIEREQKQHAPILTGVIQTIARVDKGRKDSSNTETEQPDIQDGISQRKVLKALRNRRLISIISIQMLAYARKKSCNVMQGVLGVFLYATNTSKRTLETLHQCGLCVSYDAVLKAMR
jgi:hypothetical protein